MWVLVAAAWLSAGATPFREAATGAVSPTDLPTDFVPAARALRGQRAATDVVTGNGDARALGAPSFLPVGVPYAAHPPSAVALVAPLVPLGFRRAALVWCGLSLAALAVLAWIVAGMAGRGDRDARATSGGDPRRRGRRALVMFAALLLWPPVLHNLEKGQWSLLVAALLALAWSASQRRRDGTTGALVAAAAACKVLPLVEIAAFPTTRGAVRRLVVGALATMGAALVVSSIVLGPAAWLDFVSAAAANATGWRAAPANTLSPSGILARLFGAAGPFAVPLVQAPALAGVGNGLIDVVLFATTLATVIRARRAARVRARGGAPATTSGGDDDERATTALAFSALAAVAVLANPLSWSHNAVLLILPAALTWRALAIAPTPMSDRRARANRALWWLAIVILSVPRATLLSLAGPLPVAPLRGLALGTHALGAAALWWLALRLLDARVAVSPAETRTAASAKATAGA